MDGRSEMPSQPTLLLSIFFCSSCGTHHTYSTLVRPSGETLQNCLLRTKLRQDGVLPAHATGAVMHPPHPRAQLRSEPRHLDPQDVDPAVDAREDHLGVLERGDAARLEEEPRVLGEEGEVRADFVAREQGGAVPGEAVPEGGDEVQRAGGVDDGVFVLAQGYVSSYSTFCS